MNIFVDWKSNKNNLKGRIIMVFFRFNKIAEKGRFYFICWIPFLVLYRFFVEWLLGVELPWKTKVGKGLIIFHGHSLVINDSSVIGENCVLRHCTTIGNKEISTGVFSQCPIIGNNVDIGSNVVLIGPITIGNNVKIGAGSVVVKDVPSDCVVVGNPARIIKRSTNEAD